MQMMYLGDNWSFYDSSNGDSNSNSEGKSSDSAIS